MARRSPTPAISRTAVSLAVVMVVLVALAPAAAAMLAPAVIVVGMALAWPVALDRPIAWVRRRLRRARRPIAPVAEPTRQAAVRVPAARPLAFALANRPPPATA